MWKAKDCTLKYCPLIRKYVSFWIFGWLAFIYNDRIYEGSFSEDDTSLLIPVLADIQVDQPEKASQEKGNFQEGTGVSAGATASSDNTGLAKVGCSIFPVQTPTPNRRKKLFAYRQLSAWP